MNLMSLTQPILALGLPFILILAIGLTGYKFLSDSLKGDPSPVKLDRFEAGNIPTGEGRMWYPLQYYGYLLIYTSIEPILTILFLISPIVYATSQILAKFYLIIVATIAILYPTIYYCIKQVDTLYQWVFRREYNVLSS
ncbi:NADH dehydrogenase subunit A [Sulfolobales archaeon HS-7]|nr:NADH dehydrogenase subunit A [Sulfolobales archaeon HS-7]